MSGRFRREILDSPVFAPLREHLGAKFDRYIEEKIVVVPGDITNDGLLGEEAKPFKPGSLDAVVHSAGLVNFEASLEKAIEVNTTGVANVIEFCRKLGAAMMHVSTCYVAGSADGHRYEDDIPENWCPDGRKSFRLEREIRDALAAVERVQAESRDQLRHAEFRGDDGDADAAARVRRSSIAASSGLKSASRTSAASARRVGDGPTPTVTPRALANSWCSRSAILSTSR